jgi:hypothetical protein
MTNPRNRNLWLLFACSTVFVLLLSSVVQRQLQSFRGPDGSSKWPDNRSTANWKAYVVGEDFPIYYVAGVVARLPGDRTLYYPASDGAALSVRNLLDNVPPNTAWSRVAESEGFHATGRYMAPPFTALLTEPLTLIPPRGALLLWRLASILMLVVAIYLTFVLLDRNWGFSGLFVVSVAAAFSFFPFVETLYQGQVDALVLLLWVMGVYFVDTKASIWSAFCFALATMIKASPVLAVGVFLLRRQWKWLIAYMLWMGAFTGVGVWQLGWQNHLFWFSRVLPMLSGGVPYFASKSLPTFIASLYLHQVPLDVRNLPSIPVALVWFNKGLSLTLYLGTLFYFWKRCRSAKNLVHELAVIPLVILLTSPESFRHHYLLAAFPLIYLWVKSREWSGPRSVLHWSILALASLAIGTAFPDYVITFVRNPVLDLAMSGLIAAATIALIYPASAVLETDTRITQRSPEPAAALAA